MGPKHPVNPSRPDLHLKSSEMFLMPSMSDIQSCISVSYICVDIIYEEEILKGSVGPISELFLSDCSMQSKRLLRGLDLLILMKKGSYG
ncbi:hypothetical protein L1987_63038 [Smallanthus sonchifolius]|uniref:Uncharacterized protein n=1 Tax=Smallanthus sonchifolius TaxID=185202 RepID=A0ACB9CC85_9ASTR|nr:hypothetical protein L1987_63038 [Smallanthus sonchifolius]